MEKNLYFNLLKCTATDIFYASNNRLLLDADKKKYTKKMGLRIHTNTARYTLLEIFLCLKNMKVTSGLLRKLKYIAPFNSTYIIPVSRGEMSIKDVLPQEELDYITHNMQVDHTCLYTIALLNPEDKVYTNYSCNYKNKIICSSTF